MKKKAEEGHENSERWLLTYSDLITLLMIFFIVMYAMSKVDEVKYNQLAKGLNLALGGGSTLIGSDSKMSVKQQFTLEQQDVPSNKYQVNVGTDSGNAQQKAMQATQQQINKYLKANGLSKSVKTVIDERGLVVSLMDTLLFDSGKADVRPEASKQLVIIGRILGRLDSYARVEGHTDNVPISTSSYKDNWQLSTARATNVVEMLINNAGFDPRKICAVGYGEYRPVASNSTDLGKQKNRRVDIIVLNSKFDTLEKSSSSSNSGSSGSESSSENGSSAGTSNSSENNSSSGTSSTSPSKTTSGTKTGTGTSSKPIKLEIHEKVPGTTGTTKKQ